MRVNPCRDEGVSGGCRGKMKRDRMGRGFCVTYCGLPSEP
jgi:hypothetical protein